MNKESILKLEQMTNSLCKRDANLQKDVKKFKSFFKRIYSPFFILDFNTHNFIDVNRAFCTLTGYTKKEILKLSFKDLLSKEDQEKVELEKPPKFLNLIKKDGGLEPISVEGFSHEDEKYIFGNILAIKKLNQICRQSSGSLVSEE